MTVWIATRGEALLGFACHDATAKGFFGPTAVAEAERGKGIGEALLFATLRGMREAGYAYAIIGGVGTGRVLREASRRDDHPRLRPRNLSRDAEGVSEPVIPAIAEGA